MRTRNSFLLHVCLPVFGFIVGSLISYNLTPERTPHHTSVVQEFLWLDHKLKNSKYKSVLDEYLTKSNYPFESNIKRGF